MKLIHEIRQQIIDNKREIWTRTKKLKKNEYLTLAGEVESQICFVLNGSLRIFLIDDEGVDHTIRFGYQNSFICSFDSFINNSPSFFTIQAIKETDLVVCSKDDFMDYISSSMYLLNLWQRALSEIIQQQVLREIDLLTITPIQRFNRLLDRSPAVFQEIPHKYIASYLRMSPETFSRLLKS